MPEAEPLYQLTKSKVKTKAKNSLPIVAIFLILIVLAALFWFGLLAQKTKQSSSKNKNTPVNSQKTVGPALGVWGTITKVGIAASQKQTTFSLKGDDAETYSLTIDDTVLVSSYAAATASSPPLLLDSKFNSQMVKVGDRLHITTTVDLHKVKTLSPSNFTAVDVYVASSEAKPK